MADPRLHNHPNLDADASASIAHLAPPVVPDHIRKFAEGKTNAGTLAHQQKLAHIGLILKHLRLQLIRLGCNVNLEKTDAGITFHIDYPTPATVTKRELDDFTVSVRGMP